MTTKDRFLLTNKSRSQYYNVIHILGEYVMFKTLHKSNAIVYFEHEIAPAKEVLLRQNISPVQISVTEEDVPELLDMEL